MPGPASTTTSLEKFDFAVWKLPVEEIEGLDRLLQRHECKSAFQAILHYMAGRSPAERGFVSEEVAPARQSFRQPQPAALMLVR